MGLQDGMYRINWDLLLIAFTGSGAVQYDGTEDNLRNELEDLGFQEDHIENIITDTRLLQRIIGTKL